MTLQDLNKVLRVATWKEVHCDGTRKSAGNKPAFDALTPADIDYSGATKFFDDIRLPQQYGGQLYVVGISN